MNIADGEDALPARFEIRIDGHASIFIKLYCQTFKGFLGGTETNLPNGERAVTLMAVYQCEPNLFAGELGRTNLGMGKDIPAGILHAREGVRLTDWHGFSYNQFDVPASPQNH